MRQAEDEGDAAAAAEAEREAAAEMDEFIKASWAGVCVCVCVLVVHVCGGWLLQRWMSASRRVALACCLHVLGVCACGGRLAWAGLCWHRVGEMGVRGGGERG